MKVWITKISDAEITIADGFAYNPLTNYIKLNFTSKYLKQDETFELGDSWYELKNYGKAYLFVRATKTGAYVNFSIGEKGFFPKWALILAVTLSVVVFITCFIVCFCFIRRLYRRR